MTLKDFLGKQFIDVIQWNEPEDGILAYRYPMQDMEIQNGGQLTVRESQLAAFVNEGKIADVFGPGLHKQYVAALLRILLGSSCVLFSPPCAIWLSGARSWTTPRT